ncbi:MAG: hypothetical protein QXS20_07720 [Candidatus Thorarchaeota archaeon]
MPVFRADHYLVAELEKVTDLPSAGNSVMEALRDLPELKDLSVVARRMEHKQWSEITGRLAVPHGSRAFWAMVKKELTPREPYHLFVRIDINIDAGTIEEARSRAKSWIDSEFATRIRQRVPVKTIRILQPQELYMPQIK